MLRLASLLLLCCILVQSAQHSFHSLPRYFDTAYNRCVKSTPALLDSYRSLTIQYERIVAKMTELATNGQLDLESQLHDSLRAIIRHAEIMDAFVPADPDSYDTPSLSSLLEEHLMLRIHRLEFANQVITKHAWLCATSTSKPLEELVPSYNAFDPEFRSLLLHLHGIYSDAMLANEVAFTMCQDHGMRIQCVEPLLSLNMKHILKMVRSAISYLCNTEDQKWAMVTIYINCLSYAGTSNMRHRVAISRDCRLHNFAGKRFGTYLLEDKADPMVAQFRIELDEDMALQHVHGCARIPFALDMWTNDFLRALEGQREFMRGFLWPFVMELVQRLQAELLRCTSMDKVSDLAAEYAAAYSLGDREGNDLYRTTIMLKGMGFHDKTTIGVYSVIYNKYLRDIVAKVERVCPNDHLNHPPVPTLRRVHGPVSSSIDYIHLPFNNVLLYSKAPAFASIPRFATTCMDKLRPFASAGTFMRLAHIVGLIDRLIVVLSSAQTYRTPNSLMRSV